MELIRRQVLDREICHYAGPGLLITSRFNEVYVKRGDKETTVVLPNTGLQGMLGFSRLARRATRQDKCNVVPVPGALVIIRQGRVYHYDEKTGSLATTLTLKNCRNVLHQSVAVVDNAVFFGEYGNNPNRDEVPVYRSGDGGRHWETIFTFPKNKTKHVHGCYFDPIEKKIWVLTGDFANECHILCTDLEFRNIEWIGNGQQEYRACNVFFEQDAVHWIMDSQLQDSFHINLDRKTRKIEKKILFPGPVWYIKRLEDGWYLAATAQEIGPGVKDRYAHLMVSRDLETWTDLQRFEHDGFPKKLFKFGVIGFADGEQTSDGFYLFAEAIRGLDGKTVLCAIK
jgi:hypothetical protein